MNQAQSALRRGASVAGVLLAALLCASSSAWAQPPAPERAPEVDTEKESYAKLPPCKLSDDGKHLAEEPCRTAKALDPIPRRPVPQAVERVSPAEAERKEPLPPRVPTPPRISPNNPRPGAPIPTAGCDVGGCYGPNGQRYNNGPGNAVVSPSGKLCSRNGAWIQC